jgi:3-phytase
MYKNLFLTTVLSSLFLSCGPGAPAPDAVLPVVVTQPVQHDSDDPAIWVHPDNPEQSIILGTDKFEETGALYAFDLNGKILEDKVVKNIDRPNNVAIITGFPMGEEQADISLTTERIKARVRAFTIPEMQAVDNGGLPVFTDEAPLNEVMGIASYHHPEKDEFYFIVSRKAAPDTTKYLQQYRLFYNAESAALEAELVRRFGLFEGITEIEAIAVDDALGYIYYSNEGCCIRKYYADPAMGDVELAKFGTDAFVEDREGIAIYPTSDSTGYILVSDQQNRQLNVYAREGSEGDPHKHPLLAEVNIQANETDGIEVVADSLSPAFPKGILVMMSDNKTFEIYDFRDIEKVILQQKEEQ